MIWYRIGESLVRTESAPCADVPALVLLTTEELEKRPVLPGLENVLEHTPSVRGARTCRAEVRPGCLSGTLVLPRKGKDGVRAAFGLLVTQSRIVLTDDSGSLPPLLHRIAQEKRWTKGTVGQALYDFFEQLIAHDLHRLEELEEQAESLEDQVLADGVESLSGPMNTLRKETIHSSTMWRASCAKTRTGSFRKRKQNVFTFLRGALPACGRMPSSCANTAGRSKALSRRRSISGRTV